MSAVDDSTSWRRHYAVEAAAARLHEAARTAKPLPTVRDLLGYEDIATAHEVRNLLVAESASARNSIGVRQLLLEAGRSRLVGGRGDMPIDNALDLLAAGGPR